MDATTASPTSIVFDADLTMGVPGCDVDDGLALLFALGCARNGTGSSVEALCTSYGNSDARTVHAAALAARDLFGLEAPVVRGALDAEHPDSDAARYLVKASRKRPGELVLSVTGPATNLKGALLIDPDALTRFREVVLMGGITSTLAFNGSIMDELNLSCDPVATKLVLEAAGRGARIVIATANNCLPAWFYQQEFFDRLPERGPRSRRVLDACRAWFGIMERTFGLGGFCCWDVLVPAYILRPDLFRDEVSDVVLDERLLAAGFLETDVEGAPSSPIVLPRIADVDAFRMCVYEAWNVGLDAVENAGEPAA